jgi:hypothetical protein
MCKLVCDEVEPLRACVCVCVSIYIYIYIYIYTYIHTYTSRNIHSLLCIPSGLHNFVQDSTIHMNRSLYTQRSTSANHFSNIIVNRTLADSGIGEEVEPDKFYALKLVEPDGMMKGDKWHLVIQWGKVCDVCLCT